MATFKVREHRNPYELDQFTTSVLDVDSHFLRVNALSDPHQRPNYVLCPRNHRDRLPVLFHLSGYFSTGYQSFNKRTLENNIVESIDQLTKEGQIPQAFHVFVDAMTYFGGSQFINSPGCGKYSDYLLKEVCLGVKNHFHVSEDLNNWCVIGASSGGYGAIHALSSDESPFGIGLAIAPDSFFEASLLPELLKIAPQLREFSSLSEIRSLIDTQELQEKRHFFSLMNVLAMSLCYSPSSALKGEFIDFPVNLETGRLNQELWNSWLEKDPVHFLAKREKSLKGKTVYLDVGKYDNYSLQFGARQILEVLRNQKIKTIYNEFIGTHRGLTKRRVIAMLWLKKNWMTNE